VVIATLIGVFGLATLMVAGLARRLGWPGALDLPAKIAGIVLYVFGYALFEWAMISNAFFSGMVRIQEDRGHQVATGGPYRIIRHPGYVGLILSGYGTGLMLGSAWTLIPASLLLINMIVRTTLEDRLLKAELPGYQEYAEHTRYRLLPGLW
jgi:protein-S-isoprenylcysteine O-methyltransferase Ste14